MCIAFAKAEFTTAQNVKIEREESITKEEFPSKAYTVVQSLNTDNKQVRYFKETDGERSSYEAKFKLNGRRYSVECDTEGNIQDVEITIKKKEISKAIWNLIKKELAKENERFKVTKIQEQYVKSDDLKNHINAGQNDNYEISVSFKSKRKIYRKEYLFNAAGEVLKIRDVKRQEYDFLLF